MANPAAQDDGLIILSDDTNTAVTSPLPVTQTSSEPVLDFSLWETTAVSTPSPVTISRPSTPVKADSSVLDFSLELDNLGVVPVSPVVSAPVVEAPKETISPTPIIDTVASVETPKVVTPTPVVSKPTVSLTADTDMDGILEGTITQLKARQEIIGQTKGKKTSRIDELSKQIEELQQQVADLKDDVVDLDDENVRINSNITALENMKMFEKTQEEEKVRAHDLKKVATK